MKINEYVIYGSEGVCLVEDCRILDFDRGEEKAYYVLKPVAKPDANLFIPVDGEALLAKVRPVLSKEEIDRILDSVKGRRFAWVEDRKRRMAMLKTIRTEMKLDVILKMAATLQHQSRLLAKEGKKLSFSDSEALLAFEAAIRGEIAFSLGLETYEVDAYLQNRMYG